MTRTARTVPRRLGRALLGWWHLWLLAAGLLWAGGASAAEAPAEKAPAEKAPAEKAPAPEAPADKAPAPKGEDVNVQWALVFENDTPLPLVLPDPLGKLTYYWYMIYRVKNPTQAPVPTNITVSLQLTIKKEEQTCADVQDLVAERHIETKIAERPLEDAAEMGRTPLEPDKTRECVALFRIGDRAAEFDRMTVSLRGLAARTHLGRDGAVQKLRERVLRLVYDYVDSRWTDTKELKYADEKWQVEVADLTDRTDADRKAAEENAERLKQLQERIEKMRKAGPKEEPKAAPKASAVPGEDVAAAERVGQPDPQLLQALAAKADGQRGVRAAFTELLGPEGRRQKSAGTVYLRNDPRFAIERTVDVGTARALKELRVFDGKSLWIHTAAKELGDSVRRWEVAGTRKEWYTVAGRPEVDFPTLVNPLRVWRLFGNDLVRLGVERLPSEAAHVFEVRPDAAFRPLLTGPLTSELLGQAAGRRVRVWIGAESGFQHRLCVYDAAGGVVASLECTEVELGAHLPDTRFAFAPPVGVKVIDMNAVMASNEKR